MADERRIVIELKATNGGASTGNSSSEDEETNLTDLLRTIQHPVASAEKAVLGKNVLVYRAWQQGKQLVKSSALYQVQRYFNLTENYKTEQDLNNTMSVIDHVSSIGTTIIGSVIAGAKAGPWGAVAGAVVGVTIAAGNTYFESKKAFQEQNMNLTTINKQSSFQQVRLGLVDDGRGTLY